MTHLTITQNVGLAGLFVALAVFAIWLRAKVWGTAANYHLEALYPWTKIMMILVVGVGFVVSIVTDQFVWVLAMPGLVFLYILVIDVIKDYDWLTREIWPYLRDLAKKRRLEKTYWVDRLADVVETAWKRVQRWLEEGEERRIRKTAEAVLEAQHKLKEEKGGAANQTG